MHIDLWVLAHLLELGIDLQSIVVILHVESSREVVELDVQFNLGNFESFFASKIE